VHWIDNKHLINAAAAKYGSYRSYILCFFLAIPGFNPGQTAEAHPPENSFPGQKSPIAKTNLLYPTMQYLLLLLLRRSNK